MEKRDRLSNNKCLFVLCCVNIVVLPLFLGQFLSTFDPFYRVSHVPQAYIIRALFLGVSFTTLLFLKPSRFFRFPRWLLIVTCVITAGWLFVYAFPSVIRDYYVAGWMEISGEKVRVLSRPNPERAIQRQMLLLSASFWFALILSGRFRFNRLVRDKEQENKKGQE